MDWNAVKVVVDVIALVLAIGAWGYAWWVGHRQLSQKKFAEMREEIDAERTRRRHDVEDIRNRLTLAEAQLSSAPTKDSTHELATAIALLGGDLKTMVARVDGLGEIVKRIEVITNRQEEFLLNMPKKS